MLKKHLFTKWTAIILSCFLLAMLAAGCGSNSNSTPEATQDEIREHLENVEDRTKIRRLVPEGTTVTLKAWRPTHTTIGTRIESFSDTLFNKWMEEQTGVRIEWIIPVGGTEADNLAMITSAGEYPDIFFDANFNYPTGAYGMLQDGIVIDIAEHLDKLPNFKAQLEQSELRIKESYSDNGELAGFFIYMKDDIPDTPWYGIMIRKDMLEKVNMEVPETYDEWYEVLTAFKEAGLEKPHLLNAEGFSKLYMFTGGLGFGHMNYGGDTQPFYQVEGKVHYAPLEEGFKTYLQMMNKWYEEGLIDQDFLSMNSISAEFAAYPDPQTGSMIAPLSIVDLIYELTPDENVEYVAAPHPVVNKGDQIHIGAPPSMARAGIQISSKTEHRDLALQYIDLYYSPDVIDISNWGPDPEFYTVDENGKYAYNEKVFADEEGFAPMDVILSIADYPTVVEADRTVGDELLLEQGRMYEENNDNAYAISSAITLSEEELRVYNSVMTNIIDYVEEMQVKYILGIESFDGYDAFIDRVKNLGIEDAIAAYQLALDRYNSR